MTTKISWRVFTCSTCAQIQLKLLWNLCWIDSLFARSIFFHNMPINGRIKYAFHALCCSSLLFFFNFNFAIKQKFIIHDIFCILGRVVFKLHKLICFSKMQIVEFGDSLLLFCDSIMIFKFIVTCPADKFSTYS